MKYAQCSAILALGFRVLCLCLFLAALASGYEWEDYDYYQMLGIEPRDVAAVDEKAIKQAYRREAKTWHPDKQQNSTVSKEEATERFRRISEAYQVLSDPEQRSMYDSYVRQQQHHPQQPSASTTDTSTDNDAKGLFSWQAFRDPLKVFEEFFFAQDDAEYDDWLDHSHTGTADPFAESYASQEKFYYYDARFGQVLRVTERDYDPQTGSHKILYQDFVEDWDPYRGTWGWYPLQSEPYLIRPQAVMDQGQTLVPPAVLQSGHFVAGIFDDCRFQIRRGTTVIWQAIEMTDDYRMFGHYQNEQCYLALRGSQIAVEYNGRIIWISPQASAETDWSQSRQRRHRPRFEARLDADGSLTVYQKRQRGVAPTSKLERWRAILWKDPNCCYSTNPAGCNRLGRLLVRVLTLDRRLEKILKRLGRLLNSLLDWLENDEEDSF